MFVNGKEIFEFIVDKKMSTFELNFVSEAFLNGFSATESREVSINGNEYDFSVD